MMIVDAQVHIWGPNTPERPWPPAGQDGRSTHPQREVPWGYEEVLENMDRAGVARAILIPPSWEGDYNDVVLAAAKAHPGRFGAMGLIALEDPQARKLMPGWRKQPGMLGIRSLLRDAPWLKDLASHWIWEEAEKAGVPITLSPRNHYDLVEDVATRHPRLKISLDHMGARFGKTNEAAFSNLPRLLKLADLPNIAVKATAAPHYTSDPYPFKWLHGPLADIVRAFGDRRVFWGTDLTRLPCSYEQAISLFTREVKWPPNTDVEWIMGKGVCEWYGWPY